LDRRAEKHKIHDVNQDFEQANERMAPNKLTLAFPLNRRIYQPTQLPRALRPRPALKDCDGVKSGLTSMDMGVLGLIVVEMSSKRGT
jgi:hypothetical protein